MMTFLYNNIMLVKLIQGNFKTIRFIETYNNSKSKPSMYFDFQVLQSGTPKMIQLIQQCYAKTEDLVLPNVKPGFLRRALPTNAPQQGESIENLIKTTKEAIFPGVMNWQSPKYFGYYPSSINATSILAEMFSVAFHSPSFAYTVAPAFTELENIVMDWSAKALGLPQKFEIKNAGGGIINNSTTESIFVSVHAAKHKKMKELNIDRTNPSLLKFVGYYGEGSHVCSERGLFVKDIPYRRPAPYLYNPLIQNYEIDFDRFQAIIEEDIKNGLIPFWFGSSVGTTFSAAIDFNEKIGNLCKKHGIWINVDSAFLGSTWISEKYRPNVKLLEQVDSIALNFSKLLLNGTGGSLFYIADKMNLNQSFGATALKFSIFKNQYSESHDIVDYKDWIVGLGRRNNALKIYYTFAHYGLDAIRKSVEQTEQKGKYLLNLIKQYKDLFQIHTYRFSVVTFRIKDTDGLVSDSLTRAVAAKIKNIKQGFCSPTEFQGVYVIRIVVGNFHTQKDHIDAYVKVIADQSQTLIQAQSK